MSLKKGGRKMFIFICIMTFVVCFLLGIGLKVVLKPSWAKNDEVKMTPEVGTLYTDLSYGEKESNRFDMYLPHDQTKNIMDWLFISMLKGLPLETNQEIKIYYHGFVPKDMLLLGLIIHFLMKTILMPMSIHNL